MLHNPKEEVCIEMFDELSQLLGYPHKGTITYNFSDIVKLTGHGCPTVAGAFLMTKVALSALYGTSIPQRGEIKVTIKGVLGEGTVGVISSVVSMITGATSIGGFHGLIGKFDRRYLLSYDPDLNHTILFERCDTHEKVGVNFVSQLVPPSFELEQAIKGVFGGTATHEETVVFGTLWQERIDTILRNYETLEMVKWERL